MSLTYEMLQLPPFLLFVIFVLLGGAITGVATFLFRRFGRVNVLKSHNQVTGFLFSAIASFYALLLGFTVYSVWGQLNVTQTNVSKEGSSAFGLYRDIKFYPDTIESQKMMILYLDFVYNVIDDEFPKMSIRQPSQKTLESFNKVFYKMERLSPNTQNELQLAAEMFHHLNELATYRGLRTASVEMEIPTPIWWPMILGALIVIFCAMLLDIENSNIHVGLTSLLGVFIGMFFFIIIILDHPYTSSLGIHPDSYMQIFNMEDWANKPVLIHK
jgi:hypothetical protein